MKFECGDLERALAVSDLMPEVREHLKHCAACRREYRLWNEISTVAKELHEDWDSPELWQNIKRMLEAEPTPNPKPVWWKEWKMWVAAAAVLLIAALVALRPWQQSERAPATAETAPMAQLPKDRDFLTEQALQEVERTEAAYRQSIDKLSQRSEEHTSELQSHVNLVC